MNHEGLVGDGRADGLLEVTAIEQSLCGGEDIWVKNIAWVSALLDILSSAWEGLDDLANLAGNIGQHDVGLIESPD